MLIKQLETPTDIPGLFLLNSQLTVKFPTFNGSRKATESGITTKRFYIKHLYEHSITKNSHGEVFGHDRRSLKNQSNYEELIPFAILHRQE